MQKKKIIWFASAWDIPSLEFLDEFNLKYNKIASAMITNLEFLTEVAKKKHTFISTGMSNYRIIDNAIKILKNINAVMKSCIQSLLIHVQKKD